MTDTITSISQISGIFAAHTTRSEDATGCTVILCPHGATGAVDVRGGAPATRETDLLRPEETVQVLHAVVLSGGSAFGLAAACGVAEELERREIGLNVGVGVVPIVSSACVFDLACGKARVWPTAADGAAAVAQALDNPDLPLKRGNVGAGTGCTVGKYGSLEQAMKAGLGESVITSGELIVGAVAAVNACGNVYDPITHKPLAGMLSLTKPHIIESTEELLATQGGTTPLRTNTTISCIVTNAKLTKAEATKVAQTAADGYAHAINPTHMTNDGDTIFVMATGEVEAAVDSVAVLATKAISSAIVDGARSAESAYGYRAAQDITGE